MSKVNGHLEQVMRPMQAGNYLCFDGVSEDFNLWLARAKIYLKKNYTEQYQCAMGETEDELKKIKDWETNNNELFEFLLTFLDKASAKMCQRDAPDNGWKAIKILKHHHMGSVEDNGMLALMNLCSISKESEETLTEYQIRLKTLMKTVEASKFDLNKLGTVVGLNGLPDEYKLFKEVVKRGRCPDFEEFTRMLREEDSDLYKKRDTEGVVMKAKYISPSKPKSNKGKPISCYKCGQKGHTSWKCRNSPKSKWCDKCQMNNHNTVDCNAGRRRTKKNENSDSAKAVAIINNTAQATRGGADSQVKDDFAFSVKSVISEPKVCDPDTRVSKPKINVGDSVGKISHISDHTTKMPERVTFLDFV